RLAALVRTVEFGAVDQCAAVIDRHDVSWFRLRSVAFFDDFVLEATGRRLYAVFLFVSFKKLRAVSSIFVGHRLLLLLHIFFESCHNLLDLVLRELWFTSDRILDSGGEDV